MEEDGTIDLLQRAAFGRQVEAFMKSDVGQYVLNRAAEQVSNAQEDFKDVDCSNTKEVFAIQNKINIASSVVKWLQDAVQDGVQALNILEDRS